MGSKHVRPRASFPREVQGVLPRVFFFFCGEISTILVCFPNLFPGLLQSEKVLCLVSHATPLTWSTPQRHSTRTVTCKIYTETNATCSSGNSGHTRLAVCGLRE